MNKETKNNIVPKFRFSEFVESGEWDEKLLSQVADYENGKAHEQDIVEKGDFIVVNSKFISSEGEEKKFANSPFCLAQMNDILMVLSDVPNGKAIAKCFFVNADNLYTVNQRICKITPTKANANLLYFLLNRNDFFLAFDDGVKQTNLRKEDVLNCPLFLPKEIGEQQKIASCLSSLDDLITAEDQKLEALQSHKKGLMQQLFPAEGEKVPKTRFNEFEGSGEWEEKTILGLAIDGFSNGVFNDPKKVGYGYKLINVSDMYSETPVDESKLSLVGISETEFLKNQVRYGDIFFTRSSLVPEGIAHSNIYLGSANDVTYDGHLIRLRPNTTIVVPKFLHYLLRSQFVRFQLMSKGKRATMTTIGQSDISTTSLLHPTTKEEQQRIADCLSSLDELIAAQAEEIEELKKHKKGLMQGLFPTNTGTIAMN